MKIRLLILTLAMTLGAQASANFQSDMMKSKRSKNPQSTEGQWTIADWLAQRSRVRLMDQWLEMHTNHSWAELVLNGAGQEFTYKTSSASAATKSTQTGQLYQADIFLSILNLNGEYQKTDNSKESYGGAAGLRLLGVSAQTTSLIARYGWRRLSDLSLPERWENQYVEGQLQLYIVQEFGLTGTYRYYLPATSNQGDSLEGHKATYGVFYEFSGIRIFADYFQEPLQLSKNGTSTSLSSDGFDGGLKLFF